MELAYSTAGCESNSSQSLEVDVQRLLSLSTEIEQPDGLTTEEWVEALGIGEKRVRKLLKRAAECGLVRVNRRTIPGEKHWSGRTTHYPVYEVIQ